MFRTRRHNILLAVIFSSVLSYLLIFENEDFGEDFIDKGKDKDAKNYFKNISGKLERNRGLLINTTNCKIPDFDVYDIDVLPFLKDLEGAVGQCREGKFNWTFVQEDKLVMNVTQMESDGYSFSPGFCCYKVIERVTMENVGNDSEKDMEMDMQFRFSDCKSLNEEKTLLFNSEFIMVECGYLKFFRFPTVYRAFHASAFFSLPISTAGDSDNGNRKSSRIKRKLQHWSKQDNENAVPPPNILIIGLDSTSRLNFRRKMPQTLKVLEDLGATEMRGFLKVGEHTLPNIVPMLTGYSEDDLQPLCNYSDYNRSYPFDPCPFIWKSFSEANYLTAISEDAPILAIFNYLKAGFHQQPTDFFLRPLMLAGLYYNKNREFNPFNLMRDGSTDCMGHQTNDELILSYVDSILALGRNKRTPVFSLAWSTTWSHDEMNGIQLSDKVYANFLSSLKDNGVLDNTILFFMGDHGYRYGNFRNTLVGFYEGKLPLLWIKLPPWIEREFPEWKHALEINSRKPTSFYTFYWTLSLILKTFSSPTSNQPDSKPRRINLKDQSFFHVQHEWPSKSIRSSCDRLGVPSRHCPCNVPKEMSTKDVTAVSAALLAIQTINGRLVNSPCSQLQLRMVTAAAKNVANIVDSISIEQVFVSFITWPGNYRFEMEVTYFEGNQSFSDVSELQRTSRLTKEFIECNTDPGLELFCYCE